MGPWFIRDAANPFRPGCSFETIRDLIKRGKVTADTILRGPTTRQYWNFASRTPGVANLLGQCHNCHASVKPDEYSCAACGAVFSPETDRQHLGLAPVHLLPGQAAPEIIAAQAVDQARRRPVVAKSAPKVVDVVRPAPAQPPSLVARGILIFLAALVLLGAVAAGVFLLVIPALEDQPLPPRVQVVRPDPAPTGPPPNPAPAGTAAPEPQRSVPAEAPRSEPPPAPTESPALEKPVEPKAPAAVSPDPGALAPVRTTLLADPFDVAGAMRAADEFKRSHPGTAADQLGLWVRQRVDALGLRSLP